MLCSGSVKSGQSPSWGMPEEKTAEEYKELWGIYPYEIFDYIISSKTVQEQKKEKTEQGYEFDRIDPVDMFPQTPHVEAVTVLTKK